MSRNLVIKELVNNPVHKCIRGKHNPFILLPIYENHDLYEEVKCNYREAIKNTEEEISSYHSNIAGYRIKLQEIYRKLDNLNGYLITLEEFARELPDDELMTYELL
ncbi:hypothetical protein NVP2275O_447 [Vibrio phage 2.275.O._10N.286.54.E11]|nr:hypothetical protein NVP2275O_447 [Vibrio phage 2.275.O._10N.286.54.E11]